jgi:hypothetical protein
MYYRKGGLEVLYCKVKRLETVILGCGTKVRSVSIMIYGHAILSDWMPDALGC